VPAKQPDIALEREKKRQELAERRREELEQQKKIEARREREEQERDKKLEARRKQEDLKREQLAQQKADDDRKRREEQAKAAKDKQREQADTKRMAALRQENLKRMQGLAGATGGPTATGQADRSSGPSNSYAGRIRARVKPNITFTDDVPGNPTAEVEVRMAPDGTITSKRVVKASGLRSWDDAVLRALDKTEVLPRDIDGRVHSPLIIEFKLRG
jgi:colicin import membrane protein